MRKAFMPKHSKKGICTWAHLVHSVETQVGVKWVSMQKSSLGAVRPQAE